MGKLPAYMTGRENKMFTHILALLTNKAKKVSSDDEKWAEEVKNKYQRSFLFDETRADFAKFVADAMKKEGIEERRHFIRSIATQMFTREFWRVVHSGSIHETVDQRYGRWRSIVYFNSEYILFSGFLPYNYYEGRGGDQWQPSPIVEFTTKSVSQFSSKEILAVALHREKMESTSRKM